jgi:hypothetical protein
MADLGSRLSSMFGDHKSAEVTVQKTDTNSNHYRSSTTNSYNKCIREIAHNFPPEIEAIAINAIDRYDQTSFDESVPIGDVTKFNSDTGEKYIAGRNILRIKGTYEFKWFAHCKTIEMWLELIPSKN